MNFLGKIDTIYSNQKNRSKKRGHESPEYSKGEFRLWCLNNLKFNELYKNWVLSGFDKWAAPSIDRIDNYKGYSFDNIQVMTWKENSDKARLDIIEGRNSTRGRKVLCFCDNFKKEYLSIISASKELGLKSSNIIKVIRGERNHTGGYKFIYI